MLKKFSKFWHREAKINLEFEPYIITINGHTLQIMKATDDVIPDLLLLEQKVYSGRTPWDRFSFKTELAKWHNSLYLVMYEKSQLVAFIGSRFAKNDMHVTNIAVDPRYQRQKIGSYLLKYMIERARFNHMESVSLEVRADNIPAQDLYKKLNFEFDQVYENYYEDHIDAIQMVLYLKPRKVIGKRN